MVGYQREHYQLYTSQLVYEEASKGDPLAAQARIKLLSNLLILELNENVLVLAQNLVQAEVIPRQFIEDAFHIAIATVHGMDYLLTWNCKHIANAVIRKRIETICYDNGYINPIICTPEELTGE